MKSFKEYIESRGYEKMPEGNIPDVWFKRNFLPMIVRCCCCDMTMASPCAWVDDRGYTYCGDCAGVNDPDYECDGQCVLCSKGDECPCSDNY